MDEIPVITVDGPSGSGKGTICRLLAGKLGFHLLDSGVLYRLTAVAVLEQGIDLNNEEVVANVALDLNVIFKPDDHRVLVLLDGKDVTREIRKETVGVGASIIATHFSVRKALLIRQRNFERAPGLVADGRDMGTVVFPDAVVKVFLTATVEERAKRRYKQLLRNGKSANLRAQLNGIISRDLRDMERSTSPLRPAVDALKIDSTLMSVDQVLEEILAILKTVVVYK